MRLTRPTVWSSADRHTQANLEIMKSWIFAIRSVLILLRSNVKLSCSWLADLLSNVRFIWKYRFETGICLTRTIPYDIANINWHLLINTKLDIYRVINVLMYIFGNSLTEDDKGDKKPLFVYHIQENKQNNIGQHTITFWGPIFWVTPTNVQQKVT
jgi:hypothetical protein